MDYEKEYAAMVQRARELHETGNELTKRQMEIVCPELRESEDERIRKAIVATIEQCPYDFLNPKNRDKMLAYLEKQRELPFVKDVVLGYPGLYYYDGERMHFRGNPAMEEKQKESLHIPETCKENADSFTDACKDVIVAIKKYLDWLTGYPDYAPKGKYSIRDMLYCLSLLEKQKEPENVSATTMAPSCWEVEQKEQRNYHKLYEDITKSEWFKKAYEGKSLGSDDEQKDQKPAEWSEEDEEMIKMILGDLEWERRNLTVNKDIRLYDEKIAWLKSLRLMHHWKPSKEQMRVLSWAANGMVDKSIAAPEMRAVLRELYEQLKKLGVKEEPEYYQHFDPDC